MQSKKAHGWNNGTSGMLKRKRKRKILMMMMKKEKKVMNSLFRTCAPPHISVSNY